MDYKYIEQLMESYWKAETSVEEEQILHSFFSQSNIPEHLIKYKEIFNYAQKEKEENILGEEFDNKILQITKQGENVKARKLTIAYRLRPLFKAAAVVAILLTLGIAVQEPYYKNRVNGQDESINKASIVAASDSANIDTTKLEMPTATILKNR